MIGPVTGYTGVQYRREAPGLVISVLRFWRSSLIIVLAVVGVTYAGSLLLPKEYTATAVIDLADPNAVSPFREAENATVDIETYTVAQANIASSRAVLQRVTDQLDGTTIEDLAGRIEVDDTTASQLRVTARAHSADGAATIANATVDAYRERAKDQADQVLQDTSEPLRLSLLRLEADINRLNEQIRVTPNDQLLRAQRNEAVDDRADLSAKLDELQINADAIDDGVSFVDEAEPPAQPSQPKPLRNAAVAFLFGSLLAAGIAWLRADRNQAAEESDAPGLILDTRLLGSVPELAHAEDLPALRQPASAAGEAFQIVTASLEHLFSWGVLLVTSPGRREGKTAASAGIAAAAVRAGLSAILVDADLRSSGLTRRLLGPAGKTAPGLTDLGREQAALGDAEQLVALSDGASLPFVPSGTDHGEVGSAFREPGMVGAFRTLRDAYDLVIVDCPAVLPVADVASMAPSADGICLVVERGTALRTLDSVRQRLDLVSAPLVGYIFNRAVEDRTYGGRSSPPSTKRIRSRRSDATSASDREPADRPLAELEP